MKTITSIKSLPLVLATSSLALLIAGCASEPKSNAYYQGSTQGAQGSLAMGGTGSNFEVTQEGQASGTARASTAATGATTDTNQFVIPLHQEQLQVGTRQVDAGSVRIRKQVTTETASQPVQVRRESVVIDRLPAGQGASGSESQQTGQQTNDLSTPFQENEMVIRLQREEPVVELRTVPSGQIVVQRRTGTEQVQVQRQLRREDVQVDQSGAPQNVIVSENVRSSRTENLAQQQPRTGEQEAMGGSQAPTGQQSGAGASTQQPITDLQQLTSSANASELAGRQVQLNNAQVQRVFGNNTALISSSSGTGSPAIVRFSQPMPNLQEGQSINVTGVARQLGSDMSQFGLDEQATQQLQGQKVYIEASRINPASSQ